MTATASATAKACVLTHLHTRSRPGILVLINDCDWELRDELDGELEDGDVVIFISTLHGG